jgi:AraC-like DNA-binding protein
MNKKMESLPKFVSQPHLPDSRLSAYVQAYVHTKVQTTEEYFHVDLFPVGYAVISFTFNQGSNIFIAEKNVTSRLNITGQLTKHYQMKVRGIDEMMYVLFTPLGAHKLLGIPQDQLANNFVDMLTLPVKNTDTLYAALDGNRSNIETCLAEMDRWFLQKLSENTEQGHLTLLGDMLRDLNSVENLPTVTELCAQLGLTKISLERYFKQAIGLPPKAYLKLLRFNKAYQIIQAHTDKTWAEIAHENGYFDQAHFIKEFKTIYGYTPSKMHQSLVNIAKHVRQLMDEKDNGR